MRREALSYSTWEFLESILQVFSVSDRLDLSEEMEFCYAYRAFRHDFHYFTANGRSSPLEIFEKGGSKCHLSDT